MDNLASFTPKTTTMFGSTKESSLTAMDDSSYDLSFSNPSDSSSSYRNSSETYLSCLYPNLSQRNFEEETDVKPFGTPSYAYPSTDTFFDDQTPQKRLIQAIHYLKESITDVDILIQLWLPVARGGECVLTTEDQPFILNSRSKGLLDYREISKSQLFATDDDSEAFFGLPSLVFLKKFPMCTPRGKEDINQNAHQFCGFLDIPVFELGSGTCLGVIEIVTTSQYVNYHDQLNNICTALEAFDLRSSEFLIHPKLKDYNGSYEVIMAEIRQVLKSVCETHCLPLAQTWGTCAQLGRGGCPQQSAACISVISSASYVFDPHVLGFYEACSQLHLLQGEGIAGKALVTNQPCFATDITAFCRAEYPLAEHAKLFGLGGAVAIRLRSTYMESIDFILEFFLPHDCRTDEDQKQMLSSISYVIQHVSKSLHVINDEELADEVKETSEPSWISHMLEAEHRGESFTVSMGSHKEEPQEFQVINQYDTLGCGKQIQPDTRPKRRRRSSVTRRSDEKKRVKAERNITLPVLQQYFPGSLKDAAKNIGVCPTTLKRICREHGIMRWPSRKIKKVGHSLKKLQLIIDSVQGAEGTIQLGSFYTNFPELSSPIKSSPKPTNDCINLFKSASCSSSHGSHNSCSSLCCSQGNTSHIGKPGGLLKEKAQDERKSLVWTQGDNHHPHSGLKSSPISRNEGAFRVQVVYGEQKKRLTMSQHGGFGDLQREIMRRFSIHDMNSITLKYLDDDSEWVLLTCDADLEECMDINIASKSCTIKLFLHPSFHLEPGSPFTSNGSS
uniref:protein NLP4-like n=1 Tax=Erigeron canadensis TaxID=72917 RepID=UPI001CB9CFF5|nr:protein NLP4-like [Erigeron canadensis]